jgi:hypothetical protein
MMTLPATQGVGFSHSASLRAHKHRFCFLVTLLRGISHHHQNRLHTMAALILTRYPGWIRTAAIISRLAHSWSRRTSTISKGESPGAPISPAWVLTIKATELHLAHPQPTTDLWRENTSQDALRQTGAFTHI